MGLAPWRVHLLSKKGEIFYSLLCSQHFKTRLCEGGAKTEYPVGQGEFLRDSRPLETRPVAVK